MIKEYTEEKIITKKVVIKTEYYCDLCNRLIEKPGYYDRKCYKVQFKTGSTYPEGGHLEYESAYLCDDCKDKIKEMLCNAGVKFHKRDLDF